MARELVVPRVEEPRVSTLTGSTNQKDRWEPRSHEIHQANVPDSIGAKRWTGDRGDQKVGVSSSCIGVYAAMARQFPTP